MTTQSGLKYANSLARSGHFDRAAAEYYTLYKERPWLHSILESNIKILRHKLHNDPALRSKVVIACWDLGHNAAGRALTLANIYSTFSNASILGPVFHGSDKFSIWPPLQGGSIPISSFIFNRDTFLDDAIDAVLRNPSTLVHLSKPRMPNMLIAIIYKAIWGARVFIDVDDEELAFVKASTPLIIDNYVEDKRNLPLPADLAGKIQTQLAVGMLNIFDGITVSNQGLQAKYGGTIIRHARDTSKFAYSEQIKISSRRKYGIQIDKKVVLFLGTPRSHKGLEEVATAIAHLGRDDVIFLIIGSFNDASFKQRLLDKIGKYIIHMEDQPFESLPELLPIGDITILLQDPRDPRAQLQVPAKLSDSIAVGHTVLAQETPGIADLGELGAYRPVTKDTLVRELEMALNNLPAKRIQNPGLRSAIDIRENARRLQKFIVSSDKSCHNQTWFSLISKLVGNIDGYSSLLIDFLRSCSSIAAPKKETSNYESFLTPKLVYPPAANKMPRQWDWAGATHYAFAKAHKKKIDLSTNTDLIIPILMITWDRLSYTRQAVNAVLANTDLPFKLFIWDNGSTDGTVDWLNDLRHENIEIHFSKTNAGLIPPMNAFFERFSSSQYVAKVDNDTIVTPGWLSGLRRVLDEIPLLAVEADHYLMLNHDIQSNYDYYKHLFSVDFLGAPLYLCELVGGTGTLIRRSMVDRIIEMPGTLKGWIQYQSDLGLMSAFYTGAWIDRLDQIGTNKFKQSEFPEYDKKIDDLRPQRLRPKKPVMKNQWAREYANAKAWYEAFAKKSEIR